MSENEINKNKFVFLKYSEFKRKSIDWIRVKNFIFYSRFFYKYIKEVNAIVIS